MSPIKKTQENHNSAGQETLFQSQDKTTLNETNKNLPPPIEEAPDLNELHEVISAEQKALCSPFISLIGEEICFTLFHEKWQKRELGLLDLENRVMKEQEFQKTITENQNNLNLILKLFSILIKDKVIKIAIVALDILKKILSLPSLKEKILVNEVHSIESLLESLFEKIGDNCQKIHQFAKEIFANIARKIESKSVTVPFVVIMKNLEKENNKSNFSIKHLEERIKLLNELLKNQTNLPDNILSNVVNYYIKNSEHQKNTVRETIFAGFEIIKVNFGDKKLRKFLGDIPRKMEIKIFN